MTKAVTLSTEALKKLDDKKKNVAEKTGKSEPSYSDIVCYVCQHCKE